jgi:hypothetical protein
VAYYTNLVKETGQWHKNLELAMDWLELLSLDEPDLKKIDRLLFQLESDGLHNGTAWYEFKYSVNRWAEQR